MQKQALVVDDSRVARLSLKKALSVCATSVLTLPTDAGAVSRSVIGLAVSIQALPSSLSFTTQC